MILTCTQPPSFVLHFRYATRTVYLGICRYVDLRFSILRAHFIILILNPSQLHAKTPRHSANARRYVIAMSVRLSTLELEDPQMSGVGFQVAKIVYKHAPCIVGKLMTLFIVRYIVEGRFRNRIDACQRQPVTARPAAY